MSSPNGRRLEREIGNQRIFENQAKQPARVEGLRATEDLGAKAAEVEVVLKRS